MYKNIRPITSLDKWCILSYYTICSYAPDNSGRILFASADLDKNTSKIYIVSNNGEVLDSFGEESYDINFYHTGRFQTWSPCSKYVYYQGGSLIAPTIIRRELATGKEVKMMGDMEGAPPFGEPIIGGSQGMLYAAGYGSGVYDPQSSPYPFQKRDEHGLFKYDVSTGKTELVLSVADILEKHPKRDFLMKLDNEMKFKYGDGEGLTLMCYCVRWNNQGDRFIFYFGNHNQKRGEPRIAYVFSCDKDFKDLQMALDLSMGRPGVHWSFHPDGKRLVGYGPKPEDSSKSCLAFVNYDGSDYRKISDENGGGHPSVCPTNYNLLVTDCSCRTPDNYLMGKVMFINVSTGEEIKSYLIPKQNLNEPLSGRSSHWLCHHPVFSKDGSKVLINSLPGKNAQILEIDLRGDII